MTKVKYLLGIILILMIGLIIYYGGLIKPRYEYKLCKDIKVNEPLEIKVNKVSWFKKEVIDVIVEGNYNLNKLGQYQVLLYDQDHLITNYHFKVVDEIPPNIKLKGSSELILYQNQVYKDEGVVVEDNYDQDVEITSSELDLSKLGKQIITYKAKDKSGNQSEVKKDVYIYQDPLKTTLKYTYDMYDNDYQEWWFKKSDNHKRNEGCMSGDELKKYNAYYLGDEGKVIYLTFDEGGNDITYVKEIADILNQEKIKATFFFTRNYLISEKEFVGELIKKGHLVANHSWHHYDMSNFANSEQINDFIKELTMFEKTYLEICKQEMPKIFRFPKGGFSKRCLKIVADLGYRSYFWSHAYYDYAYDLSYEEAYQKLIDYYHPGAIYLLHPSNKGNYEALADFIKEMKALGYRFACVDEIK